MKGGGEKKVEHVEGKLRVADVENLPDDVDEVIKNIGEIDF